MKLLEIFSTHIDRIIYDMDKDTQATWAAVIKTGGMEAIGKRGDITVYISDTAGRGNGALVCVAAKDGMPVAKISMRKKADGWYIVEGAGVNAAYRGFDLAYFMYRCLLGTGIKIIAGGWQSEGGTSIWRKLADDPDFLVLLYDMEANEYETLDGDEIDSEAIEGELDQRGFVKGKFSFPDIPKKFLLAMKR